MTERTLFGTDGIRGVANVYPMTAEMALKVGQATAAYFLSKHPEGWKRSSSRPRIIIGKDTRISNYMLEQAVSSGICSMGVDTLLLGPIPTPGISFLVRSMRADAGVVISASHNNYEYSGIKLFGRDGDKLPDDEELELEALILGKKPLPKLPTGQGIGKAARIDDALGRYIVYTKAAFPSDMTLDGMRIALDCAHGAAYKAAPTVFTELGAEVVSDGVQPNGRNINDGVGALHPENICAMVKEYRADIGISLDGDADRVLLVDEHGEAVDGDEILAITALEMARRGELAQNTVVGTVMSNLGLREALRAQNIGFTEVPVGDRYILTEMKRGGFNLGGEPSGHIIFGQHASTGDGILAALKVLEVMCRTRQPLSQLKKVMKRYPQVLENVRVADKKPISELPVIQKRIEAISTQMGQSGRVLVRYSGTEPIVRVMVEGESLPEIRTYASEIADLFRVVGRA